MYFPTVAGGRDACGSRGNTESSRALREVDEMAASPGEQMSGGGVGAEDAFAKARYVLL
jgi:hypothetical protein